MRATVVRADLGRAGCRPARVERVDDVLEPGLHPGARPAWMDRPDRRDTGLGPDVLVEDRVQTDPLEVDQDPAVQSGQRHPRVEPDRVLEPGQVGADAVGIGDVVVAAGLRGRIVAAVTGVRDAVVLEPGLQLRPDPQRLGIGQEVDQVDRVGVVAEQHRARPAHLDHDLRQLADLAVAHHPARLDELREPAPGVVDVHRHARGLDRGDDGVGVVERRGDRLLAEDAARAGLDGDLDDAAVEMVRRDDRDELGALGAQHLGVVVVDRQARVAAGPVVAERVPRGRRDVAARDELQLRDGRHGRGVAVRDGRAERRVRGVPRQVRRDPAQPHEGDATGHPTVPRPSMSIAASARRLTGRPSTRVASLILARSRDASERPTSLTRSGVQV